MPEKASPHIQNSIQKRGDFYGIQFRRAQPGQQSRGRFQFVALKIFGQVSGQRAIGTIKQYPRLTLHQQAQFRQFVLENSDARNQSMHILFLNLAVDSFFNRSTASCGGGLLTSAFQFPAVAEKALPESCTACCATTFISFSSDEKRCIIS